MGDIRITLAPAFGCVVFDVILSWFVLMWMAIKVSQARKKYDVKYPALYSDKSQAFNCVQRAHQNTLEVYPQWLIFLILGGLQHPSICSIAGFVWLVSRIFYALGYYTGDPKNRNWGAFGYFGLFSQIGCTISFALHLVGYL